MSWVDRGWYRSRICSVPSQGIKLTCGVDLEHIIDRILSTCRSRTTIRESPNISELEKMFPVDIDRDLEPLFKQHHRSIDAIQRSIEIASRHFSGDRFFVTIIKDPEHDSLNQLSVIVKTALDTATAFQKTSDIDAEFSQDSTLSDILIHVEFQ